MSKQLYSFNELRPGDKFGWANGNSRIYTKVKIDFYKLNDGSLLMPSNIPDGLVMDGNGTIGLWSLNPDKLNEKILVKIY